MGERRDLKDGSRKGRRQAALPDGTQDDGPGPAPPVQPAAAVLPHSDTSPAKSATYHPPPRRLRRESRRIVPCTGPFPSSKASPMGANTDTDVGLPPLELVAPRLSTEFSVAVREASAHERGTGTATGRAKMTAKAYALTGLGFGV